MGVRSTGPSTDAWYQSSSTALQPGELLLIAATNRDQVLHGDSGAGNAAVVCGEGTGAASEAGIEMLVTSFHITENKSRR